MTNQTPASSVLAKAIIVVSLIEVWSGKITASREADLDATTSTGLPPHDIYSDGQKQIIDPKVLAKLETQRRMAQRDFVKLGFATQLGYIIAPGHEDELYALMNERRKAFELALDDLTSNLDSHYADWEKKHPGHESFLRRKRPTATEVKARCKFNIAVFRVAPVDSEIGQHNFEAIAKTTVPALVQDIANNAGALLKGSFSSMARVTQRQLGSVRDLVAKLKGFSMFDARILPSAEALETVLAGLPHTGPLTPAETTMVAAMLRTLSDPTEVLAIGARHFANADASSPDVIVTSAPPQGSLVLPAPATQPTRAPIARPRAPVF